MYKKFLVFYEARNSINIFNWFIRLCLTYRNIQSSNRYEYSALLLASATSVSTSGNFLYIQLNNRLTMPATLQKLWNYKFTVVLYKLLYSQQPATCTILKQINPVHTHSSYFFNMHFNRII